jgi:hypothetical protein
MYQNEVGKEQTVASRDKQTMINSEMAILHSRPVLEKGRACGRARQALPDLAEEVTALKEEQQVGDDDPAVALLYARGRRAARRKRSRRRRCPTPTCSASRLQHPDPGVAKVAVGALVDGSSRRTSRPTVHPPSRRSSTAASADYEKRLDASRRSCSNSRPRTRRSPLESPQTTLMAWRDETLKQLPRSTARLRRSAPITTRTPAVAEARNAQMTSPARGGSARGQPAPGHRQAASGGAGLHRGPQPRSEREVARFARKRNELEARLAQIERELKEFPGLSAEYRALRRERDADEEQYTTYRQRLRDARLATEMDQEKITSTA